MVEKKKEIMNEEAISTERGMEMTRMREKKHEKDKRRKIMYTHRKSPSKTITIHTELNK